MTNKNIYSNKIFCSDLPACPLGLFKTTRRAPCSMGMDGLIHSFNIKSNRLPIACHNPRHNGTAIWFERSVLQTTTQPYRLAASLFVSPAKAALPGFLAQSRQTRFFACPRNVRAVWMHWMRGSFCSQSRPNSKST